MKKSFFFCLILILCSKIVEGQWVYSNNSITATYTYSMNSNEGDTKLSTNLSITDFNAEQTIDFGNFSLRLNNIRNSYSLSLMLQNRYTQLKNAYGINILKQYAQVGENFLLNRTANLNSSEIKSLVFQTLCIYNSLLKASVRDTNTTITFTPNATYFTAVNSFFCNEDVVVDVDNLLSYLNSIDKSKSDSLGIEYYNDALSLELGKKA